jgi:hypothetical protein
MLVKYPTKKRAIIYMIDLTVMIIPREYFLSADLSVKVLIKLNINPKIILCIINSRWGFQE